METLPIPSRIWGLGCRLASLGAICLHLASPHRTLCRIDVMVKYLLDKLPNCKIGLLGLLPRGKNGHVQPSMFTSPITKINAGYK